MLVFLAAVLADLVYPSRYAEARVQTWVVEVFKSGDGSTGYILSNNAGFLILLLAERGNNASPKEINRRFRSESWAAGQGGVECWD